MGDGYFAVRDGEVAYLVTSRGVTRAHRMIRVEQAVPCVMCLTDSADRCTCVGFCGSVICAGAEDWDSREDVAHD